MANAIFHTYKIDEYKELEREIPLSRIYELFRIASDENSRKYVASLIDEILDEPVAVINKTMDHKLIKWQIYDFFTLLEPVGMSGNVIKLRINPHYLTITKKFVANPFLEF